MQIRWRFFFYFDEISKTRILELIEKASFKGCKKAQGKKVIKSKKEKNKSCPKFWKLGNIFLFSWNPKNDESRAKNASIKGSKKAQGKQIIKSKDERN